MNHDQYQIPASPEAPSYESSLHDVLRIADSCQYNPETQPEAFQFIKDIEQRIHQYRDEALKADVKKSIFQRAVLPYAFGVNVKSPLERLVDAEGVAGGQLFKANPAEPVTSERFWYHGEYRGRGDWYYERVDTRKVRTVLNFQTTSTTIEKLANGVPVPFAPGEFEQFTQLPALYEQKIRREVYGKQDDRTAANDDFALAA